MYGTPTGRMQCQIPNTSNVPADIENHPIKVDGGFFLGNLPGQQEIWGRYVGNTHYSLHLTSKDGFDQVPYSDRKYEDLGVLREAVVFLQKEHLYDILHEKMDVHPSTCTEAIEALYVALLEEDQHFEYRVVGKYGFGSKLRTSSFSPDYGKVYVDQYREDATTESTTELWSINEDLKRMYPKEKQKWETT